MPPLKSAFLFNERWWGVIDAARFFLLSLTYSTASFAAAIRQQISVVNTMNDDNVVLTTGGRSEDFARKIIDLPDHSFIQMGDFSGYTIKQCAKQELKKAYVAGFIGKLAKMAKI